MRSTASAYFLVLLLAVGSGTARADAAEGLVRVVGSGMDTQTVLTPENEYQGTRLCGGETDRRIRHLSALVVRVSGDWQLNRAGEKRCLEPKDFKILRMTSGRDAVIGALRKTGAVYTLTGDDGKVMTLSDVPDGLKKLEGQKVIVDLKQMANPVAKDSSSVVVTYLAFP